MTRKDQHIVCFTTGELIWRTDNKEWCLETNHENIDLTYYKLKVVNAAELSKASDNMVR